jgi:hypothetical protein
MHYRVLRKKQGRSENYIPEEEFDNKVSEIVEKYRITYQAAQVYIYAVNNKKRETVLKELEIKEDNFEHYAEQAMEKIV